MNVAERKARELYAANAKMDTSGMSIIDLCRLAQKQDKLYRVALEREDRKMSCRRVS